MVSKGIYGIRKTPNQYHSTRRCGYAMIQRVGLATLGPRMSELLTEAAHQVAGERRGRRPPPPRLAPRLVLNVRHRQQPLRGRRGPGGWGPAAARRSHRGIPGRRLGIGLLGLVLPARLQLAVHARVHVGLGRALAQLAVHALEHVGRAQRRGGAGGLVVGGGLAVVAGRRLDGLERGVDGVPLRVAGGALLGVAGGALLGVVGRLGRRRERRLELEVDLGQLALQVERLPGGGLPSRLGAGPLVGLVGGVGGARGGGGPRPLLELRETGDK